MKMAPKDFTDSFEPSLAHDDSDSSCSSCDSQHVNNSKKERKSVHFNEQCYLKMYGMPTKADQANAWYTPNELQQLKKESKYIAKMARNGQTVEGEEMSFGLESQNREKSELKAKRRYLTWDLVMDGQYDHVSPLEIAAMCSQVSEGSSKDAERSAALLHLSILKDQKMALRPSKKILSRKSSSALSTQPNCLTTVSRVA